MKIKVTFLLVTTFFITNFQLLAQKNVVKLNLPSLAVGNIYLSYERVLTDKKSVNVAVSFMPSKGLMFSDLLSKNNSTSVNSDDSGLKYEDIKMSGFSVTPEFRFYTARRKEAPRGFYVAPYIKYQMINFKGDYTKTYTNNDYPNGHTAHFNGKGNYGVMAAGVLLGYQWLIADRVSIDWSFFGLGLGNYKLKLTESSQDAGPNYYKSGGSGDFQFDSVIGSPSYSTTPTSRTGSVSFFLPHLRSGLAIGFAF